MVNAAYIVYKVFVNRRCIFRDNEKCRLTAVGELGEKKRAHLDGKEKLGGNLYFNSNIKVWR